MSWPSWSGAGPLGFVLSDPLGLGTVPLSLPLMGVVPGGVVTSFLFLEPSEGLIWLAGLTLPSVGFGGGMVPSGRGVVVGGSGGTDVS